eukprot:1871383-Prorocentrum_lima.AAC.1
MHPVDASCNGPHTSDSHNATASSGSGAMPGLSETACKWGTRAVSKSSSDKQARKSFKPSPPCA